MKKYICAAAVAAAFTLGVLGSAQAAVPATEICLGGVTFGTTEAYATGIYGSPDKLTSKKSGEGVTDAFEYGKGFQIVFHGDDSSSAVMTQIQTTANNGIKTPKGIHVGSTYVDMLNAYGLPDAETGFLKRYFREKSPDQEVQLIFEVKDNKITDIYAGRYNKESLLGLKGETVGLEQEKATARTEKYVKKARAGSTSPVQAGKTASDSWEE